MNTWIAAASEAASETLPLVTLGVIGGLAALMYSGFVIVALVKPPTPPQTTTPPSAPAPRSGWTYTATVAAVVGVVVAILAWLLPR
ncbi:hypothetical protein ACH4TC_18680 [Streptomyces spororaveus]|uniref:hypothetical protein n=1 Tax=Streptomyces spororaveus TaxID=284039 RepID=UPI0037BA56A4